MLLIMLGLAFDGLFSLAAFMVCFLYFIFAKEEVIIADLFFLLPFATIFKISSHSTSFVTILLFFAIVIILVKRNGKFALSKMLFLGLLFAFISLVVDLFHGNFAPIEIIKHIVGFFLLHFILNLNDAESIRRIIKYFGIGLYISSVIAIFAKYIPNFYTYVRQVGYDWSVINRFTGMNGDPNYYSICLILALMGALCLYKTNKLYFLGALIFTFYFGFQTYSKSFFIAVIIAICAISVELLSQRNKMPAIIYMFAIGMGSNYILGGHSEVASHLIKRFTSARNIEMLTTGRSVIWEDYLNYLFSNPLSLAFGDGVSASLINGHGTHNFYIELLYYFGLIGAVLFSVALIFGYKSACRNSTKKELSIGKYSTFLILILYFGLQMVFSNELYFHIGYIFLLCVYPGVRKKTDCNKLYYEN